MINVNRKKTGLDRTHNTEREISITENLQVLESKEVGDERYSYCRKR